MAHRRLGAACFISLLSAFTLLFLPGGIAVGSLTDGDPGSNVVDDNDADGVPDSLELLVGSDPSNDDTDADGYLDGLELAVGTDPTRFDPDPTIGERSGIALGLYPLEAERLGILILIHSGVAWEGIDGFRVYAGRGTRLRNQTEEVARVGTVLRTSDDHLFGIQLTAPLSRIGSRIIITTEFQEFGEVHSVSKAFGFYADQFYVSDYRDGGDGYLYNFYDFSMNQDFVLAPATSGGIPIGAGGDSDGDFLDDFIFMEKILRTRGAGVIIDTVIDNRCDEDPGERCPTNLNTVGEVRVSPGR